MPSFLIEHEPVNRSQELVASVTKMAPLGLEDLPQRSLEVVTSWASRGVRGIADLAALGPETSTRVWSSEKLRVG